MLLNTCVFGGGDAWSMCVRQHVSWILHGLSRLSILKHLLRVARTPVGQPCTLKDHQRSLRQALLPDLSGQLLSH